MRTLRVLVAVSAAAVLAAACGEDSADPAAAPSASAPAAASSSAAGGGLADKEPAEILSRARAALSDAETVRLKGGGATGGENFQVDMRYGPNSAYGTVSNNGQTIELRRVDKTVYLKADTAFWTQTAGAEAAKLFGGKFLKAPLSDKRVAQLAQFTDKDAFAGEVLEPDGDVTKGQTKDIRGTAAIGLESKKAGTADGTLWIATEGEPVPLRIEPATGGDDSGSLDFLEYGEPVEVQTPPAAQTIDVTKLGN